MEQLSERGPSGVQVVDRDRRGAIDAWELRAIREKQLAREQWDMYWQVEQDARMNMLNTPPDEQRDVRYIAKLCAPLSAELHQPCLIPTAIVDTRAHHISGDVSEHAAHVCW